tara:strand:+ start:1826 stop:3070 length:1245 start_codon:yes stop_codon:yes gene_type:complete
MENFQFYNLIPENAIKICKVLQSAGHQASIVGGCIRDLMLNITPKDWDITTSALPNEVISLFAITYPTGIDHGTITVSMGKNIEDNFEVTTFRTDGQYLDGRRPNEVSFIKNIEEDLARRDFTINSMAFDPVNNNLIDPFNGQLDINNKIIKAVGDANLRFQEDGLRIMRAARFAARFEYEIEISTLEGMKNNIDTLKLVSKERISDELSKTLLSKNPYLGLQILNNCGALDIACQLLKSRPEYLCFLNRNIKYSGALETRLAYIYANCKTPLVQNELFDLKFSSKEIKRVAFLLNLLDELNTFIMKNTKLAFAQFIAKLKNETIDDWQYTYNEFITLISVLGFDVNEIMPQSIYDCNNVFSKKEMNINGNDLINLGFKPGPAIKIALDKCYQEILENPQNNNKEYLILFLDKA